MIAQFIRLVILDVDGILTDGRKYYGLDGMPFAKTYCDKDFTAIKRLRGAGVAVCFLSGDEKVNKAMAKNRNIDFYSARGLDKADFVEVFETTYGTSKDKMLYLGDDLFDLSIMKSVGYAFCPMDSPNKIKKFCGKKNTIDRRGGENVVARLVDILLDRKLIEDATMEQIEALDRDEKF
tara:strand:- start:1999 stop:2535 length:537 start_codon:yes stop_codon:yes gene_type:complete